MSKSTSGADLFVWAEHKRRSFSRPPARAARWAPRRRNGFAAALAVVVETARHGEAELKQAVPHGPRRAASPVATVSATPVPRGPAMPAPGKREPMVPAQQCGTQTAAHARCPRCGIEGEVDALFGYRKIDGKRRPQSWCRGCRRGSRPADASPLVREAKAFAREAVRSVEVADLPLWSPAVAPTTQEE